ncbi:zinc finger HIT domain-containing protein 2 [Dunckerocampus dactyliophorus]|uniref:zinc finger HIT domain-containing protein 2 n=1 Tax=Dunckerocampus dactyliophorus TaxID=161453 RepID=UPI0024062CD7|nr:zinc finger HIT domain-containing protein 2 [Dunckerocampus dactyliophorus]
MRRTLPPSVRSLLTDIGPKDVSVWSDDTQDAPSVSKEGILLPVRRSAPGREDFLTPVKKHAGDGKNSKMGAACMFCNCKPACYTCPRCNLSYCGVACYRSPAHSLCSEEFYKESVLQELKNMGKTEHEGKAKMLQILLELRQKAQMTDGGMESVLREAGMVQEKEEENIETMDLLSRLAELQESGAGSAAEIEAIMRELEELGGQEGGEEPTEGVAERLSELDLDQLSEEELWALLDSQEKEKFMSLLKGGALGGLIPMWRPWWEEHEVGRSALVEVLEEEVNKQENNDASPPKEVQNQGRKMKNTKGRDRKEAAANRGRSAVSSVPLVCAKIPNLTSLCPNPSPLVCYGLVNALYCYSFTLQLFNGDVDSLLYEFCDLMLSLSEALSSSRVFTSIQEAVRCGETLILGGGYLDKEASRVTDWAMEGAAHIMTGRDNKDATGYTLAALSQLRSALSKARAALSKDGEEGARRQKYFLASKKCEFFQAWTLDNSNQTRRLALELWNEHSRRERGRESMEKTKTLVEQSFKKGKRKGNSELIQELN